MPSAAVNSVKNTNAVKTARKVVRVRPSLAVIRPGIARTVTLIPKLAVNRSEGRPVFQVLKNDGRSQRAGSRSELFSGSGGMEEGSTTGGEDLRPRFPPGTPHTDKGAPDKKGTNRAMESQLVSAGPQLDEGLSRLQVEGMALEERANERRSKRDDSALKESLYKFCHNFRVVLIKSGMAVTFWKGEAKEFSSVKLEQVPQLHDIVFQVCTIAVEVQEQKTYGATC